MQANRFVSIGTYLPSAMLVAINFTVMTIALWVKSGRPPASDMASTLSKGSKPEVEIIENDGSLAIIPKKELEIVERPLFLPITIVVCVHFLGVIPLYIFNNTHHSVSPNYDTTLIPK